MSACSRAGQGPGVSTQRAGTRSAAAIASAAFARGAAAVPAAVSVRAPHPPPHGAAQDDQGSAALPSRTLFTNTITTLVETFMNHASTS
jgi:hypothetical protein